MKFYKRLKDQGFTLVELMVVVAIIGILSAVAIPNFKRYQAKTKTSEAKLQLSSIYSALTSLQSDYDSYGSCLTDAGYTAPAGGNYYAVGFSAEATAANKIITDNGGICASVHRYAGKKVVGGTNAKVAWVSNANFTVNPEIPVTGTSFVAGAIGVIDPSKITAATADAWSIDENKTLINQRRGY